MDKNPTYSRYFQKAERSYRRKALTAVKMKLKVIDRYESGESIMEISKSLGVNRVFINAIIKDKQRLLNHVSKDSSILLRVSNMSDAQKIESSLISWVIEQNIWREPVDINLINLVQEKAKSLYIDLKMKDGINTDLQPFLPNLRWFGRFKERYTEFIRTKGTFFNKTISDTNNRNREEFLRTVNDYKGFIETLIQRYQHNPFQVFSVDELVIKWKHIPEKYKSKVYANDFPNSDDSINVLIGINAAGDFKLQPLLVYRVEHVTVSESTAELTSSTPETSNPQIKVTTDVLQEWFSNNFLPEAKVYCKSKNVPFRILLLLGYNTSHLTNSLNDFHSGVQVIHIPPNVSPKLNPMEQGVSEIFSYLYHRQLLSNALESMKLENSTRAHDFWGNYNMCNCIRNIDQCWKELVNVYQSFINSSWNSIYPSFVTNSVQIANVINGIVQDIGLIRKDLEKVYLPNCLYQEVIEPEEIIQDPFSDIKVENSVEITDTVITQLINDLE